MTSGRLIAIAALVAATALPATARAQGDGCSGVDRDGRTPAALIERVRCDPAAIRLPDARTFATGSRAVAAGTDTTGTVAVVAGNLDVYGTIRGDAIALDGDVVVHAGGHVTGTAFSALGAVRVDGGLVDGEARTLGGEVGPLASPAPVSASARTLSALKLSTAWLGILLLVGLGVYVFAGVPLDTVVATLQRGVPRSLGAGLLAQLAFVPALIVLAVAVGITVIGLLLIPFLVVAYVLAAAGLLMLGFLAVAVLTGRAVSRTARGSAGTERGRALHALVIGVSLYLALWIAAAGFTWQPVVGGALRALALAVTWVAVTAGFGAALLSRGGTRIPSGRAEPAAVPAASPAAAAAAVGWQTPTPIGGIVAARRPAATATSDRHS